MRKIFLAGHNGMVGKSIHKALKSDTNIEIIVRSKDELNLCNQDDVKNFFLKEKPAEVIIAAAKVGGIYANSTFPADFIYENLQIQNNIIHSAHISDIQKILFLGSSCIYPKYAKQPITEEELLTGVLEPTNEAYAIAKIAGIKMCESYNIQYQRDYRSIMPTNLYGPGDNYDKNNSLVSVSKFDKIHLSNLFNFKNNKIIPIFKKFENDVRRQDTSELVYLDGSIYIAKVENYIKNKQFLNNKTQVIFFDSWKSIEIDTKLDLILAEKLYLKFKKKLRK